MNLILSKYYTIFPRYKLFDTFTLPLIYLVQTNFAFMHPHSHTTYNLSLLFNELIPREHHGLNVFHRPRSQHCRSRSSAKRHNHHPVISIIHMEIKSKRATTGTGGSSVSPLKFHRRPHRLGEGPIYAKEMNIVTPVRSQGNSVEVEALGSTGRETTIRDFTPQTDLRDYDYGWCAAR